MSGFRNSHRELAEHTRRLDFTTSFRAIGAAVSVAGLHPVGRGFESLIAHLNNNYQLKINAH